MNNHNNIPIAGPWITQLEIDMVTDAVTNGWYDKAGDYQATFEKEFSDYTNRKYAVSLPSCTSAIHLILLALNIGPEDEVIVPDITWIASASSITHVGATPVFADIDKKSWCLDAESFRQNITEHTRAVIVVDLYGNMPDFHEILEIANEHDIIVIEDAAEAIGSSYNNKLAGGFGLASVFSFHGSKTITTGEGGMLVTDDKNLYERVKFLCDHGRVSGDVTFCNSEVAYKYKMSNIQAALGLAQLQRIDELVACKRKIFLWYSKRLQLVEGVELNSTTNNIFNSYWMVTIVIDPMYGLSKWDVIQKLAEKNISTRPFFSPLSSLPAYKGYKAVNVAREQNIIGYDISQRGVNMPSAMNLTESDVDYIVSNLKRMLKY